jgi:hypothetical protein
MDQNTLTESTGPHLIKTFEQSKDSHLPEGIQDQNPSATKSTSKNPSATNSASKMPENSTKPTTNTPENSTKPTFETTEAHLTETCRHLKWISKSGILPPRLATCRVTQCVACYNDKASRLIWQEKGSTRNIAVDPLTMMWQFDDGIPHNNSQQEESKLDNLTPKLLQQSQKLSHESFKQWMFKPGILPKPLGTCQAPKCVPGYNGKASQ